MAALSDSALQQLFSEARSSYSAWLDKVGPDQRQLVPRADPLCEERG